VSSTIEPLSILRCTGQTCQCIIKEVTHDKQVMLTKYIYRRMTCACAVKSDELNLIFVMLPNVMVNKYVAWLQSLTAERRALHWFKLTYLHTFISYAGYMVYNNNGNSVGSFIYNSI